MRSLSIPLRRPEAFRRGRRNRATILLAVAGLIASCVTGVLWREQARRQASRSFEAEAAGVGAAATTSLARMDDLAVQARELIAVDPALDNRGFARWYANVGAGSRYQGVEGFGYIQVVRPDRLPAFVDSLRADPVPGLAVPAGRLTITPGGKRRYYCLARLGVLGAVNQFLLSPGLDYCAIPGFPALSEARDSGLPVSFTLGGRIAAIFAPMYRGGGGGTVAARRARIGGYIVELFDLEAILQNAAGTGRGLTLTAERRDLVPSADSSRGIAGHFASDVGALSPVAAVGPSGTPVLSRRFTSEVDGRWVLIVSRDSWAGLLSPDGQGAVAAVICLMLTALALFVVETLRGGRALALRMVDERTEQLRHQALHDALTDLPNRKLLLHRAQALLEQARDDDGWLAAMFIDIDGFKAINDSFGHAAGDELLRCAGRRIASVLRSQDTVGRVGGDEFVVLAAGAMEGLSPDLLADRLRLVLREPFAVPGQPGTVLSVTASIGVAVGRQGSAEELLRDADIALYQAKDQGKDRFVVFRHDMAAALQERVQLENDLRQAVLARELTLAYQPVFDLESGRLVGAEALLRWWHPTRGLVSPADFVPVAEESGSIVELGEWVIGEATRQAAEWLRPGVRMFVSVNVSARQLEDPGLVEAVRRALQSTGIPPRALVLEITESVLMRDPELAASQLQALGRLGVRVAIDDFGTGYSSLAYLHRLPVDALKIDRSFVQDAEHSAEARALITTLIQLGQSLQIDTVAEGIETDVQCQLLVKRGCRYGQGYLLAKPGKAEQVDELLAQPAGRSVPAPAQ